MFDCKNCEDSCCKTRDPQLTISDVDRIIDKDSIIYNEEEHVFRIKKVNNACIFFKNNKCSIYKNRPLACRMYPYNPIFRQGLQRYSLIIDSDKTCKEIGLGHSFNVKPIALQWRKERIEHDMVYKK